MSDTTVGAPGINSYAVFFAHIEAYGLLGDFFAGRVTYHTCKMWGERFGISPALLWKLAIRCDNQWAWEGTYA